MFLEILKAIIYGIVEGITEWLPISSTGHLILLEQLLPLKASDAFMSMFDVVIQLGAILAVVVLFFHKLNPFSGRKSMVEKRQTWQLWFKVIVAVLPSVVLGLLLASFINVAGYFLGSWLVYGLGAAAAGIPLNLIQSAVAAALYLALQKLVRRTAGKYVK